MLSIAFLLLFYGTEQIILLLQQTFFSAALLVGILNDGKYYDYQGDNAEYGEVKGHGPKITDFITA